LIGQTLDSICSQTFNHWECIIVNDSSTDYTKELLGFYVAKDSRIKYFDLPKGLPKGGNSCRNYGFSVCKGEYVNWFDDDDIMVSNKLSFQMKHLACSDLPFMVCQSLVFEGSIENILGYRKSRIYSPDFFNDFVINEVKWLTQAPLIKKKFLLMNNISFNVKLYQSQERDYFVKILSLTMDYLHDSRALVLLRKHQESISYSKADVKKQESNFFVNKNILKEYTSLLNADSKRYLLKSLKSSIRQAARYKNYKLCLQMLFQFTFLTTSKMKDVIKVLIGVIILFFFNKGDKFFN